MLPNEAAFAASGTCLIVQGTSNVWIGTGGGERARVFRSTDRGRTWSVSDTPIARRQFVVGNFLRRIQRRAAWRRRRRTVRQAEGEVRQRGGDHRTADKTWRLAKGPLPGGLHVRRRVRAGHRRSDAGRRRPRRAPRALPMAERAGRWSIPSPTTAWHLHRATRGGRRARADVSRNGRRRHLPARSRRLLARSTHGELEMTLGRIAAVVAGVIVVASCSRTPASSTPAPSTAPTASAGGGRGAGAPPRPAVPGAFRCRATALAKLRANYVAQVMTSIAGRENQPAEVVFKNVQVLKGITAAQLVQMMDTTYGRGDELELHELPSPRAAGQLRERHVDRQKTRALHAADDERSEPRRSCRSSIRRTRPRSRARPVIAATTSRRRATISRRSAESRARRRPKP